MIPARFALIGVAGFVARRHLDAIDKVGGQIVAALDPHDSVGALDRYSLTARYSKDEPALVAHLEELARRGQGIDYLVVCSPNFLHARHIELGLRLGAHVICEKPLVTRRSDFARLSSLALAAKRQVHPVLQLRHHPRLLDLAREVGSSGRPIDVCLDYVTPRGPWYESSWKGDVERSGGLLLNIGVHFLDALLWIFGPSVRKPSLRSSARTVRGELSLERANVRFCLSIDAAELPSAQLRSFRRLTVLDREVPLDADLEGLHDLTYAAIRAGEGLGLDDAFPALDLCWTAMSGRPTDSLTQQGAE